mmetsp:Transcript_58735/g.122714  ORF Transcript_58735/g.122714 Transcript_58735/m.122714 type:complete len:89 (+) Transcript_58735:725-991(+)|eukprot:CAMPEP_0172209488 /NCGR_PEP_ID=MMETSP1050-20130122/35159_1 /TAXON_ID=233186 /ORGANISM="Cryptomonas curvata, Strain CCAP979/52" /LENGTH=88 /DNA_ID=CAMNT_0012889403 /DNA_START=698 /DNA_END=964 /DNA_ORIENTATION=+
MRCIDPSLVRSPLDFNLDVSIEMRTRGRVAARCGSADAGRRRQGDVGGGDRDDWAALEETGRLGNHPGYAAETAEQVLNSMCMRAKQG